MSTGISTLEDIELAVQTLRENGCEQLILLKCTSTYPATPENSNLKTIPELRRLFNCEVGLSDHTMGIGTSVAAVALGASVIEKHFCLSRAEGGVDSAFSLEPAEMKLLVTETERAFLSLGNIHFGILKAEESSKRFKRSVYAVKDIKKGDLFSEENIRIIRPGDGINPKYFERIIGTEAQTDIPYGTPLKMESFKNK
jgi:sialic acid synthase SpsE